MPNMMVYRRRLPMNHPSLGCYYQGPKPANSQQLSYYPQLGSLGQASELATSAETLITGIKNFFAGLFGKDPNKANYDAARQAIWSQFSGLVNQYWNGIMVAGTTTQSQAQVVIAGVKEFQTQLTALTNQYRTKIEASWIDPRYHDFYDQMQKVADAFTQKLPSLPGGSILSSIFPGTSGESSYLPWVLAAAAFLLFRR